MDELGGGIMLREMSQTEDKYCMISLVSGI